MYLNTVLSDIQRDSKPPKTLHAEHLYKLNEAVFNLPEDDVVDKKMVSKLFKTLEGIRNAYNGGKVPSSDPNFFYDYLALLGTMQNQHFFSESQTDALLSWINDLVGDAGGQSKSNKTTKAGKDDGKLGAELNDLKKELAKMKKYQKIVEDLKAVDAPSHKKKGKQEAEEPSATNTKGKGKGKAEEPMQAIKGKTIKGKGKDTGKDKGKGKEKGKSQGKGKGKATHDDYLDYDDYADYSKGKGGKKGKSKGKGKGKDYYEEPIGKGKKGTGKGKNEDVKGKSKGKGKGNKGGYSSYEDERPPMREKGKDKGKSKGKGKDASKGKSKDASKGKGKDSSKGKGKDKGTSKGTKGSKGKGKK